MSKLLGLFPGQGSQSIGMGKDFFEQDEQAKNLFEAADKALGYSISKLCFEGPEEELTLTQNAQPAILLSSIVAFKALNPSLAVAAGHSLGEYSALVAAESLSLEDALQLVHKRGTYMQEAVKPGEGTMAAIMGPTEEEINEVVSGLDLNCPGQTVVAGDLEGVKIFSEKIAEKGAKVIPLKVSAPFHCSLMKPAADKLAGDLDAIEIKDAKFPIYANVNAKPVQDASEIRQNLKDQVCGSVRWTESITNLVKTEQPTLAVELGAGGVLSKLLKRIDKSVPRLDVHNPETVAAATGKII